MLKPASPPPYERTSAPVVSTPDAQCPSKTYSCTRCTDNFGKIGDECPLSGARVAVEELVDVHVVHAGERAGRQRRQDVGVGAARRPRHSFPPLGHLHPRPLAALAVQAVWPRP